MGRVVTLVVGLVLLAAPAAAKAPPPSWAQAQIETVTAAGLLGGDAEGFRPDDPLTRAELAELLNGLAGKIPAVPADPAAPVRLAGFDAQLVRAIGLGDAARGFANGARGAGLNPPTRFGTEVVARLLGLRTNHPVRLEALELGPNDPITRAEAAFSVAKALALDDAGRQLVRDLAATFSPEPLEPMRQSILQTAISLVGYPYVWGGTSEKPQGPFGKPVPGGFDCSGLAWRIFKLSDLAAGTGLASTLKGRTTYAMSGEVPRRERIPFARLQPADLVFFGAHGPSTRPNEVDHMGIYLGAGWMVHSSRAGVQLSPIGDGSYRERFAWGRRPLAEAGLL